ncbi:MAG: DUF2298 domain-containing protein [Vicinamibacterales bacterium]
MRAVLGWYVVVQGLGTAAFVLTRPVLQRLPDAGYGVSKSLGVLAAGLLLWLGTALGLLRNDPGGAVLVLGGLVTAAAFAARRGRRPGLRVVVASEIVFAAAFGSWCLVRSLDPAVAHTEQPMDLMLLGAVSATPTFPPLDPWLAGYPVGYYYLGYWLVGTLGFLTGQPPEVAYNLGLACWFALLALGCYGLGFNLAAASAGGRDRSWLPVAAGAGTALVVTCSANLHLIAARLTGPAASPSPLAGTSWWWWASSRALRDLSPTGRPIELITEFPFFSYLLGDAHPHVLAMPFVVLAITGALALWLHRQAPDHAAAPAPAARTEVLGLALAFVVTGALVGINTWDLPAALGLVVLAASWPASREGRAARVAGRAGAVAAAAVATTLLVYFPYLVTAQSQVQGLLPNLWHPTPLVQYLTMFGTLLPGVAVLARLAWEDERPTAATLARSAAVATAAAGLWLAAGAVWAGASAGGEAWMDSVAPGLAHPLLLAGSRWLTGWPVLVLVSAAVAVMAAFLRARLGRGREGASALTFGLLLACAGLGLTLVPELAYLRDVFTNRMNTVFKFYYQAWLFLAIAGTMGLAMAWRRGGAHRASAIVALGILAWGFVYPAAALWTVVRERPARPLSLDALAVMRGEAPDEWAAIDWVRQHTAPGTVVVQAAGDSYRPNQGRLSAVTGRPTLLGWQGHERQWRGAAFGAMAAGRTEALRRIYNPPSAGVLRETLETWHVEIVQVGPQERARYSMTDDHERLIAAVMVLAFERGGVRLYRRRG